jgi:hypothetical protein
MAGGRLSRDPADALERHAIARSLMTRGNKRELGVWSLAIYC